MVYKTKEATHKILLSADDIKKVFDNIPDDDICLLGFDPEFTHPKNLILTYLPVLPPRARPFIVADGMMCDDDLTLQFVEIIKNNNHLKDENLPETKFQKYLQTLKFRIKCLFDNSKGKSKHSNGRPFKGMKERITNKDGLVRNNMMGEHFLLPTTGRCL